MYLPTQFSGKRDPRQGTIRAVDPGPLVREPRQAQIGLGADCFEQAPRFWPGDDQRRVFGRVIRQAQPRVHRRAQYVEIVPLRRGRSDQREVIL